MRTYSIFKSKKTGLALMSLLLVLGCQTDDSNLQDVKASKDPNVFIDTFSGGLDYGAFGGTDIFAFQVDNQVTYNNSSAAMRIDVPNEDTGLYAGGAYLTGVGRDLSSYNALTFWAKSSVAATVGVLGFGVDFDKNKYTTSLVGTRLSTAWRKYIVPIPDASKLKSEKGLFYFSAGAHENGGNGFSFWLDEVKFEYIGTLAHVQPIINSGLNTTESLYLNTTKKISNISATFSLSDGTNPVVNTSPYFFTFTSSNTAAATVDTNGVISQVGSGTAVITATVNGVAAKGSITIQSAGTFIHATTPPTRTASDVISVFSNAYTNIPVEYYNGYWLPYQNTQSADFNVTNDDILSYTNFNFVGIQFSKPTINVSAMTYLHLDVYVPASVSFGSFKIEINDFGSDAAYGGGNDTSQVFTKYGLASDSWNSIDIPLTLANRAHLAQLVFSSGNIPNFYADNIYFYKN